MALNKPTVDEFVTRFPQFEGKEDLAQIIIDEASNQVSETWLEQDQKTAIMYLTAHLMTMQSQMEDNGGAGGGGSIKSESFGPISVSYGDVGSNASSNEADAALRSTSYGLEYIRLRNLNFPAIAVV